MVDFEEPSGGTRVCHTGGANVPYGRSDRYTAKCDEYGYAYFDIYAFDTTYTSVVHDVPEDCSHENIIPSSGEQVKKFSYKVPCMLYDFCEHPGPSDCDSFYEENGHGVILSEDMKLQEHVDSYLDGVAGEIGDRKHLVLIPAPYWLFKNIWVPSKTETVGMEIVIVEKIENRPHHIIVSLDDKHSRVKIPQGDSDVELPNKVYLKVEDLHWGTEDYYARKIWLHFQPHHYPNDVLKVGFRVAHGIVGIESMHVSMQCYTPSSPPSTSPSALPSASPSSSPSASPSLSPSSMPSSSPSKFCPDSVHMESSASEEEYSLVKIAAAGNNEIMLDVFQYLAPTVEELATYLPGNEESGVGSECYNEKKGTNMDTPYGHVGRYTAVCVKDMAEIDVYVRDSSFSEDADHNPPEGCAISSSDNVKHFRYMVECVENPRCPYPVLEECVDVLARSSDVNVHEIMFDDMVDGNGVEEYIGAIPGSFGHEGDKIDAAVIAGNSPIHVYRSLSIPKNTAQVTVSFMTLEHKDESRPANMTLSGSNFEIPIYHEDRENELLDNGVHIHHVKTMDMQSISDVVIRQFTLVFSSSHNHYPSDVFGILIVIPKGTLGIKDFSVDIQCYAPTAAPTLTPTSVPTSVPTLPPTDVCPYVQDATPPGDNSIDIATDEYDIPVQAISYNSSAVVVAVQQWWWYDPVCKYAAYYKPYDSTETIQSTDHMCDEQNEVAHGESFEYTIQCYQGMAQIEIFLYEPMFPENPTHHHVYGQCSDMKEFSMGEESDHIQRFIYEFPCEEMRPICEPEDYDCDDDVTRSIRDWSSAVSSNHYNYTSRTYIPPSSSVSLSVKFTLDVKHDGDLMVSVGKWPTLHMGHFTAYGHENSFEYNFGDEVPVRVTCTDGSASATSQCDVTMAIHADLFDSSFYLGFSFKEDYFVVDNVSIHAFCEGCPYVQDATPPGDNSIDIATDEEEIPVQAVSYNSSAVVVAVEQLWWYDPVCKYAAYYKPYDSTKTIQSTDHMCDEQNEVTHGEAFQYTIQCYQGMAQIEIFLYEPMFPENPTHHHVYGQCTDMKSISESDKIQRFIYEFPCEEMRLDCEPEDYDCDDDVTRSIRDWSSAVSSNHYNYTSRTYIPPSSSTSLSVKFTLDVKHDGDLMVSVGKKPTLKMGHFAAIGQDNSFEYTFGDEVPVSVSCTVGSGSATSQCDVTMFVDADMFDDIFYLGFSFKDGHFVVDNVSIYAYCEGCPYVEQMEPSSSITHNPLEPPIYILDYGHTDVTFLVKQEFLDDTLCLLSVLYDKKEHGGIVETCANTSNVEPGEPEVHTAQCVNGKVTVTVFAYDEKLVAGDHIDVPDKCHVIDSDHTHKYVFTLPCSYGPPACKPEEDEPCGSEVTKTAGDWSTYLSHYGTKIVGQTYILPEKTSSITAEFSLTKEALGDLIVMAGKHDFRIGTFAPGDSEDHLSGQFPDNVGVVVSCYPSTTHCHVGMTVPSSFFQTPDVFFLAFKTQVGTLTVDVDSVRVRSNCESKCPAEIDWGTTKPPIPHSAVRLIRQTPTTVTVKVAQEWTNSVCRMLVNYTDNYLSTPHCHDYHAVPYGELKDEFTIDCAADGYARGTVHAFDEFFGDVIEGTLAMKCPDPKSFHESGYRLDFAYPCDVYCPTPEPERMPIQIDALGLAQTVKENGKKFIKIPRDIEAARTVVLPPSLTTLTIKFDLHKSDGPAGTLLLTVGYTRLHLDSFSVGTWDDDSYYMDAYEPNDVFVSISSSSSTKTSFTITISNIEPFSHDRRVNFAIEMKNMDITVSPIYMNGS